MKIVNTLAVAVLVLTGDPDDPSNVHRLEPGDEFTASQLPISVLDESQAGVAERRASSQSVTGRRASDQGRQRGPFGARDQRAVNREVNRGDLRVGGTNQGGGANIAGNNAAAPSGNAVGGTGPTNDGSSVLKNDVGEHVQGATDEKTKARDTGGANVAGKK